jgi:hypothetical protein
VCARFYHNFIFDWLLVGHILVVFLCVPVVLQLALYVYVYDMCFGCKRINKEFVFNLVVSFI